MVASFGLAVALFGVALASVLGAIGSSIGMGYAGRSASGVLAEKPDLYGRALVIQAIPGTQAIYGFLVAVLLLNSLGVLGGTVEYMTATEGFLYLAAATPVAVVGLFSGIHQGKVAASAIVMAGKDPSLATRGIILAAMVETAQLLALLVSILIYIRF